MMSWMIEGLKNMLCYIPNNSKIKEGSLSLSKRSIQRFWKEEVPVIPIPPTIEGRKGWLHSGHFERGGERVDYVVRLDKYVLWLRYKGDERLYRGWQSVILHRKYDRNGIYWSGSCPFCCSQTYDLMFYDRSLRCSNCLELRSRSDRQNRLTEDLRRSIRNGDLSKVSRSLQGSYSDVFRAQLAMELSGLAPVRFSSKSVGSWDQVRYRSIR